MNRSERYDTMRKAVLDDLAYAFAPDLHKVVIARRLREIIRRRKEEMAARLEPVGKYAENEADAWEASIDVTTLAMSLQDVCEALYRLTQEDKDEKWLQAMRYALRLQLEERGKK